MGQKYTDLWVVFDNDFDAILNCLQQKEYVVSGMAVTPSAGLVIAIAAGVYRANSTKRTYAGGTLDLTAAVDPALPRKVLITGDSAGVIAYTAGAAASANPATSTGPFTKSPAPPDIPANKVLLAEVWVAAGETIFIAGDITDRRVIVPNDFASQPAYIHKAISYLATVTDEIIGVDCSGGAIQITLPTAGAAIAGKLYTIKDETGSAPTFNITVVGQGGQTLDGNASIVLKEGWVSMTVYSNGTNWFIKEYTLPLIRIV